MHEAGPQIFSNTLIVRVHLQVLLKVLDKIPSLVVSFKKLSVDFLHLQFFRTVIKLKQFTNLFEIALPNCQTIFELKIF